MSTQAEQQTVTVLDADGERNALSAGLTRLFEVAAAQQRDYKLIAAVLDTIREFVLEARGDVLVAPQEEGEAKIPTSGSDGSSDAKLALRPEFRARIESVLDSWSDDEAAWHLGIGVRQVRRRAQRGTLHFFEVGRRRRYPLWQFDSHREVLPGLSVVLSSIPKGWKHEVISSFVNNSSSGLRFRDEPVSPIEWLMRSGDPSPVVALIPVTAAAPGDSVPTSKSASTTPYPARPGAEA